MGDTVEAVLFAVIILTVIWWPFGALMLAAFRPERLTFREITIIYGPIMVPAIALTRAIRWIICHRAHVDCKHNIKCKKCTSDPIPAVTLVRDGLAYKARPSGESVRQGALLDPPFGCYRCHRTISDDDGFKYGTCATCRNPPLVGSACDRCGKPLAAGSGEQQIRLCASCAFKGSFGPRKFT